MCGLLFILREGLARLQHLGPVQDTLILDVHSHMVPAAGGTLAGS